MAGAFCPICYEIVDIFSHNLESVAGCGHVFHESCLQKWVAHSPVSPRCPLCKTSCAARERQRLYFQTSADSSQQQPESAGFCFTDTVYSEVNKLLNLEDHIADKADLKHVLKLEEKVRVLKKSLELARQQISELQAVLEENKMKVETISEILRLANQKQNLTEGKLRKTQQELDGSRKEKSRLLKEMEKLEKDIAVTKLVENVDLSEDEVLNLTSAGAGRSQSKDVYIEILAKALVTRNWAFKNLMTTCNEHCLEKDNAKRESSKLRAKVEQMQARLREVTNALERSENASLRSLGDAQSGVDLRSQRSSVNRHSKVQETEVSVKPATPQHLDRDEFSRASRMEDSNQAHIDVEKEDMDPNPATKHTLNLSPRKPETCTNAMDRIRACPSENISASECAKSSITEARVDESTVALHLDALPLPIRRERKSSLVEDSYFPGDSVVSWQETARNLVGSSDTSRFNLSGPNGPSGRALIKPPPSFIVPLSLKGNSSNRQGKRPKVAAAQGLKIDHFFGRH